MRSFGLIHHALAVHILFQSRGITKNALPIFGALYAVEIENLFVYLGVNARNFIKCYPDIRYLLCFDGKES